MLSNHAMGVPANTGRRLLAPRTGEQGNESDRLGTDNKYEVSLVNNGGGEGSLSDELESISSDEEEEQAAGDDSSENGNRGGSDN